MMMSERIAICAIALLSLSACSHDKAESRADSGSARNLSATAEAAAKEAAERHALIAAMKQHPSLVDAKKASGAISPTFNTKTSKDAPHSHH
jgi:hypothetical protein